MKNLALSIDSLDKKFDKAIEEKTNRVGKEIRVTRKKLLNRKERAIYNLLVVDQKLDELGEVKE